MIKLLKQLMLLQQPQVPGQLIVFPLTQPQPQPQPQTQTQSQANNTQSEPDPKSQTQATQPPVECNHEAQSQGCTAQILLAPKDNPQQSSPTQLVPNPEPVQKKQATPSLPQLSPDSQPQVQVYTESETQPRQNVLEQPEPDVEPRILMEVRRPSQEQVLQLPQAPSQEQNLMEIDIQPQPSPQPRILIEVKHPSGQQPESQSKKSNSKEIVAQPQQQLLNESENQPQNSVEPHQDSLQQHVVMITVPPLQSDMECFFEPQPPSVTRSHSPLQSQLSAHPESAQSDLISLNQVPIEHSELQYALEPPLDLEEQQTLFFENMQAMNIDSAQMSVDLATNEPVQKIIHSIPEDLEEEYILQEFRELELERDLLQENEEQVSEFLIFHNSFDDSSILPTIPNDEHCDNMKSMDIDDVCRQMDNGSFQCRFCKTVHIHRRHIVQHIRNVHEVRCKICNERFRGVRDYKAHMAKHRRNEMVFACDQCNVETTSQQLLDYHRKQKHSAEYVCGICSMRFDLKSELQGHLSYNHSLHFDCEVCGKDFEMKSELQAHLIDSHREKFVCNECCKCFGSKRELKDHVVKCHTETFICRICEESCRSKRHLQAHYRTAHPTVDFGYPCSVCKRTMATSDSLRKHLAKHKQKFKCPDCDKVLSTFYWLTKHLEKHRRKRQRTYPCSECDKEFSEEIMLKMHLLKHAGIKPYQCNICGMRYSQRTPMMNHWKLHPSADETKPPPKVHLKPLFKKAEERILERRMRAKKNF